MKSVHLPWIKDSSTDYADAADRSESPKTSES